MTHHTSSVLWLTRPFFEASQCDRLRHSCPRLWSAQAPERGPIETDAFGMCATLTSDRDRSFATSAAKNGFPRGAPARESPTARNARTKRLSAHDAIVPHTRSIEPCSIGSTLCIASHQSLSRRDGARAHGDWSRALVPIEWIIRTA